MKEKRFQECNKIVQIWRYRWYLLVPFKYFWYMHIVPFIVMETEYDEEKGCIVHTDEVYYPRGKNLWSLLIGLAQGKMKWYYTSEEVFKNLGVDLNDLEDEDEDNIS